MPESAGRERDLSAEEVEVVAEITQLPEGAQVLEIHSYGTYDGTRFDGIDPSALYDSFFICPQTFREVSRWLEDRLIGLGWPRGIDVNGAAVNEVRLPWRQWSRQKEGVELFDFMKSNWTRFPRPPTGWSMLRINYWRKPARDFSSDDDYQEWFNDGAGKGERWRNRSTSL